MYGIIQHMTFCVWFPSLNILFEIHPRCSMYQYFLFFMAEKYSLICICLFTHSSTNGHMVYFHHSAIANSATGNMCVHVLLWEPVFNSFGNAPRSGTIGSYGNAMCNFLRNHQTAFHSCCIILHPCQENTRVPISPHSHEHLFSAFF